MSAIPLRGRSTQIYGDAVALGTHTSNNHGLFEGDELFKESPIEDLDDQVYILRRYNGEPIAHMPVMQSQALWPCNLLMGIGEQQHVSSLR